MKAIVVANGKETETELPSTIERFVQSQGLLPGSGVVEHNG